MKKLITIILLGLFGFSAANAQTSYQRYDDRNYYDEEFDWHWDVRVRITDGIKNGLITNWESKRLYNKLERLEEKEYAYMADGDYTEWEQDDIWQDVAWLNRKVGIELSDYDRTYYGFNRVYFGFNSYPFWYNRYYNNGWDFYRFDNLGWGSYRYGYAPRYYYPRTNVYVFNNERYIYKNGQRYQNNNINSRNSSPRVDNRANGNAVRRDRTDPANRVGSTNGARRAYGTTSPNGRTSTATRPSSRTATSPNSRSYTPSSSRDVNRSSNGNMRSSSPSSSARTAPSRSSSSPSATTRSSSPSRSSSARQAPSRSSSSPSATTRSSSPSRSSSARQAPSRSSSRPSATTGSSSPSRSSSARQAPSRSSSSPSVSTRSSSPSRSSSARSSSSNSSSRSGSSSSTRSSRGSRN